MRRPARLPAQKKVGSSPQLGERVARPEENKTKHQLNEMGQTTETQRLERERRKTLSEDNADIFQWSGVNKKKGGKLSGTRWGKGGWPRDQDYLPQRTLPLWNEIEVHQQKGGGREGGATEGNETEKQLYGQRSLQSKGPREGSRKGKKNPMMQRKKEEEKEGGKESGVSRVLYGGDQSCEDRKKSRLAKKVGVRTE